ncbi:hypothetical protein CC86DRAFT_18896 [Ophiobolus disseminans]|uniref:ceramidase n=1 Tax=Ophiobolus disseminans TaxID=1469910 RepID=A0A6A7A1E8_9PLEO|nr:hypothetical protein CC86DRAFT_18896 [Ophiobolus disseminans]
MAPTLRARTSQVKPESYAIRYEEVKSPVAVRLDQNAASPLHANSPWSSPPVYKIDLSLPPAQRYSQVAIDYQHYIHELPVIFDDVCASIKLPSRLVHFLARIFLHRVCSKEQTEELKGISQAIGLPLYLLVAFNVLLDLFMGCTSGGALCQPPGSKTPTMMHFRTLDWGMPELRDVLVQYDFVERPGGEVIASTISYVGFVGVLTGLRQGLSVSINFRPYHNNDKSMLSNVKFYAQQLAVLLGFRPSIASIVRDFIVPRTPTHDIKLAGQNGAVKPEAKPLYGEADILATLPGMATTVGYLIFCTGDETIILEKDRKTAKVLKASEFITVTNHDVSYDAQQDPEHTETAQVAHAKNAYLGVGMADIVEESIDRKRCLVERWEDWSSEQSMRYTRKRKSVLSPANGGVPLKRLKQWMLGYPTSNEETHFVCIMDPVKGVFRWVRRYEEGEIEHVHRDFSSQTGEDEGAVE